MERTARYSFFALLIVGSFIGIWHALPLLTVIADEMYFVGGVLRAMQHHTIVPLYLDVPYGTLTYLLSYILHIPLLAVLFLFNHGNVSAVIQYLELNPHVAYLVPRALSAFVSILFALWYERLLAKDGVSLVERLAVVSIPTMTMLPAAVLHTGKVWALSTVLITASMLMLYRALKTFQGGEESEAKRAATWSIFSACAAFANFPLAGIFLLNIPILFIAFRRHRALVRGVIVATLSGAAFVLVVFALNFRNILFQVADVFTHYHPIGTAPVLGTHISTFASLVMHTQEVVMLYPLALLLIALGLLWGRVRNELLWRVSLSYAVLYFVVIVVLVTWSSDTMGYLRYLTPLAFFFSGMIASLSFKRLRPLLIGFILIQCAVYIYTLYLLSVPTTLNAAYDDIVATYGNDSHLMIYNDMGDLDLPRNTKTALTTKDAFCASRCEYYKTTENSSFVPLVVGFSTDWSKVHSADFSKFVWISNHPLGTACAGSPVRVWGGDIPDADFIEVDHGFGNYFDRDLWGLSRMGKNAYLYSVSSSCMETLRSISSASAGML